MPEAAVPTVAPGARVVTDPEGVDGAEHWSAYLEGTSYGVDVSYIHLSTARWTSDHRCTRTRTPRSS